MGPHVSQLGPPDGIRVKPPTHASPRVEPRTVKGRFSQRARKRRARKKPRSRCRSSRQRLRLPHYSDVRLSVAISDSEHVTHQEDICSADM